MKHLALTFCLLLAACSGPKGVKDDQPTEQPSQPLEELPPATPTEPGEIEDGDSLDDGTAPSTADVHRTVRDLSDHPERLGFPESRYLKFVLLRAID